MVTEIQKLGREIKIEGNVMMERSWHMSHIRFLSFRRYVDFRSPKSKNQRFLSSAAGGSDIRLRPFRVQL
jgi:hypothetical protein